MNVVEKVSETVASLTLKEISLALGVKDELEKLEGTTSIIKAVLLDAEEKKETNPQLRVWLDQLKDVFYEAEDILDEFKVEEMRRQFFNKKGITIKVWALRSFFSRSSPVIFRSVVARKMKSINKKLDDLVKAKDNYGLEPRENNKQIITGKREKTHPFFSAPDIIGRDAEKKDVIGRLLMDIPTAAGHEGNNISVIPIVGIGGVGKTSLAKLVYNDPKIQSHFELKFWICVSFDFEVRKLIEEIVKSATKDTAVGETNYSSWDMERLLSLFKREVEGKKYLLVLDDVWNEDQMKWNELEGFLRVGANGSKILVTTRIRRVASIMSSIPPINLQGLPHDQCMPLFVKTAFKGGQNEADRNQKLVQIGKEIVEKCNRVPLAIVTLGALLSATRREDDWKMIRDSEVWEIQQKDSHILPALKLSYEQLTPPLRRCFAYCAAFPRGYPLAYLDLIPFWISHGLLESPHKDPEEVAVQYMEELRSKFLFQDYEVTRGSSCFRMHDLVYDLALSIAENEFYMVTRSSHQIQKNARHLCFQDSESLSHNLSSTSHNLDHVRSFGTMESAGKGLSNSIILTFLPRFKYLRFLDLSESQIEVLPTSISMLKHLRYLGLEGNNQIKRLPSSICRLYCLQTLFFHRCSGMEALPRHLSYFISLRYLSITTKQYVLPKGGLGCLSNLRSLLITECENLEYLCEDFGSLTSLRRLKIHRCSRLKKLAHGVKTLGSLRDLLIYNCESLGKLPEVPCLQKLEIKNCPKLRKKCQIETGENWPKIKHIPKVYIDDDIEISYGVEEGASGWFRREWCCMESSFTNGQ